MSRARTFARPGRAPAADPFTFATPHFQAAARTCERTGPAFQVTRPKWWRSPLARLLIEGFALVGFFLILFIGYACIHG